MGVDPFELELAQLLRAGLPAPPAGWQQRTLAGMAAARPRRHPNLITIIVAVLLLLLLAAGVYAAVRFFLEGRLRFYDVSHVLHSDGLITVSGHTIARDLRWGSADKPAVWQGGFRTDLSRDGKTLAFQRGNILMGPGMRHCDVYLADADGSNKRNVSRPAGLGGINCLPVWSPNGTMIYFAHVDPVEGKTPCEAHFEMWLMRADGTGAHRLTPKGAPTVFPAQICWSPDSTRLLSDWMTDICDYDSRVLAAFTVDVRTNKIQLLPNIGMWPAYSPDGSQIASMRRVPDTANGEKGDWNQLLLTDADGSNPRVLVQQFVSDAAVRASHAVRDHVLQHHEGYDWVNDFWDTVGPKFAAWSPKGNQIAFLAAMPCDPKSQRLADQIEVWVYDLRSKQAIRITHDNVEQEWVNWK
jgi:hypothetical protein